MISRGPGLASDENTGDLQNAASINTKPGSSHSEDKINNLQFDKYLCTFFFRIYVTNEYEELQRTSIDYYIQKAIDSRGSDYDLGMVLYYRYKHYFK